MKIKILITLIFTIFVGCNQQAKLEVPYSERADISLVSSEQLCIAYSFHDYRSNQIKQELAKRRIFTDFEWQQINNSQLYQGMSTYAAYATFGVPPIQSSKDKNMQETWLYRCNQTDKLPYCPKTQITFQNKRIITILQKDD